MVGAREPERREVLASEAGVVTFTELVPNGPTRVGMELGPHDALLGIVCGKPNDPLMVGVRRHARVLELLVEDGQSVEEGDALAVVEEREPTIEDFDALLREYWDRGRQLQTLRNQLRTPSGSLRAWFSSFRSGGLR